MDGKASESASGAPAAAENNNIPKPQDSVNRGSEDKVVKAPGEDGSHISREEFEKNPQDAGLHAEEKEKK